MNISESWTNQLDITFLRKKSYVLLISSTFQIYHALRTHRALYRKDVETLRNSASIHGPLKKITLTTLLHGTPFHHDHPTAAQTKDATSASKRNYSSFADPNYYHSIKVSSTVERKNYYTDFLYIHIHIYISPNNKYKIIGIFEKINNVLP